MKLELDEFFNTMLFRDRLIFDCVAFYDIRGKVVVQSEVAASALPDEPLWHKTLSGQPRGFYVYQAIEHSPDLGRTRLYYTKTYTVKGHSIQAVAVFSNQLLQEHFLKSGRGAGFTGILFQKINGLARAGRVPCQNIPFPIRSFSRTKAFLNGSVS